MPADGDTRVLSYHDVLLRKSDVDILRGPDWLNDQIIAFYFEYLVREICPSISKAVALIPGAMSFLLLNTDPSEAAVIFEALKLHERELVVFAVNDNPEVDVAAGGAHWSCLAYHRSSNTFKHYDSYAPHNRKVARNLAGAAAPLVRSRTTGNSNGDSRSSRSMFPGFVEVDIPQQQNGNDCGMYVLAVTRRLCDHVASSKAAVVSANEGSAGAAAAGTWELSEQQENELLQQITPAAVRSMRDELLRVIEELAVGTG